jgi:hypothetical protein
MGWSDGYNWFKEIIPNIKVQKQPNTFQLRDYFVTFKIIRIWYTNLQTFF